MHLIDFILHSLIEVSGNRITHAGSIKNHKNGFLNDSFRFWPFSCYFLFDYLRLNNLESLEVETSPVGRYSSQLQLRSGLDMLPVC